jgi:hypothetical protein
MVMLASVCPGIVFGALAYIVIVPLAPARIIPGGPPGSVMVMCKDDVPVGKPACVVAINKPWSAYNTLVCAGISTLVGLVKFTFTSNG